MVCTAAVFGVAACSTDASLASGQSLPSTGSSQSARVRMSGGYVMNEDGTLQQPETNATVPKLNPAALQFTPEGAELAARHFLALTEYAWATGDTQPMKNFSSEECEACADMARNVDSLYSNGGWTSGTLYRVKSIDHIELVEDGLAKPDTYGVAMTLDQIGGTRYEARQLSEDETVPIRLAFFVNWNGTSWLIDGASTLATNNV